MQSIILFFGDIAVFYVSLYVMLTIRYAELPDPARLLQHLAPFSILFVVWVIVHYIAGLYEKNTTLLKKKLVRLILNTQITNIVIAIVFFYFIPYFTITPKTNLFIYLVVSSVFIVGWRLYGQHAGGVGERKNALVVGTGDEVMELVEEVNTNSMYNVRFISSVDLDELEGVDFQDEIIPLIYTENVHVVAIDLKNEQVLPLLPHLYNLIFSNVRFVDMHKLYEDIFDRVPLSLVQYNWFLENISVAPHVAYDALKRLMDIVISILLGIPTLLILPFAALAIKLDDLIVANGQAGRGAVFIVQERVGKNNRPIRLYKLRTMTTDDSGSVFVSSGNAPTRVGSFLRKTRIDELPQLWNVLRGELSLIGPRPELPRFVKEYEEQIPYYNIRHLIKPGLSGWAQLYHTTPPKRSANRIETQRKLSYDMYYIKNRSFWLDLRIALKTIRSLLARSGS